MVSGGWVRRLESILTDCVPSKRALDCPIQRQESVMKLLGLTLAALGSFSVAMAADVSVTLTVAPAAGLGPGNNLTYTAIVKNAGPGPAGAVSLAVTLPAVNIPISVTPRPQCAFNPAGTAV